MLPADRKPTSAGRRITEDQAVPWRFTRPSRAAFDRLWVADDTRIPCGEGVFWLAAVRDVFSRRIVGWKTSDLCDTDLILAALEYGIWSRDVRDGHLIHHSDRGSNAGRLRS